MGMFDTIRFEVPLPDLPDPSGREFQTKDFDCLLDEYRVTAEGRLQHEEYEVEDRSDPNAEGFYRLIGMMTRVNQHWVDSDFTGDILFYGDDHTGTLMAINLQTGEDEFHPGPRPEWYEYLAHFDGGRLTGVRRVQAPPLADSAEEVLAALKEG